MGKAEDSFQVVVAPQALARVSRRENRLERAGMQTQSKALASSVDQGGLPTLATEQGASSEPTTHRGGSRDHHDCADSSRLAVMKMTAKEKAQAYNQLIKIHHENESVRREHLLKKGKGEAEDGLGSRKSSVPVPMQMYERAVRKCDELADFKKAGALTAEDEGVPPGQKFQHLSLQKLY